MSKGKPRWKDLPFYERFAKQLKQHGVSEEMCEHIRERGREKENKDNKWNNDLTRKDIKKYMMDCKFLLIEDVTSYHGDVFDHPDYKYTCENEKCRNAVDCVWQGCCS